VLNGHFFCRLWFVTCSLLVSSFIFVIIIGIASEVSWSIWTCLDLIIVNKKYYIWKVGADGIKDISNHVSLDYGTYVFEYNYHGIGGLALLHLMTQIQKISNLSMVSMIDFYEYIDGAKIDGL
jgi:hypothetical protein